MERLIFIYYVGPIVNTKEINNMYFVQVRKKQQHSKRFSTNPIEGKKRQNICIYDSKGQHIVNQWAQKKQSEAIASTERPNRTACGRHIVM